jgi:PAS domain S-box-containing protein
VSRATAPACPAHPRLVRLDAIQTADAAFAVDDGQRIVSWSPGAERLFGRTAEEAVGRLCFEVLGTPDSDTACRPGCRPVLEARRGRAIVHPDIGARHADGHSISLRATSFVVPDGSAPAPGSRPDPDGPDGPMGGEPPIVVHLVREQAGASRRVKRRPAADHPAAAVGSEQVPALISPLTPRELEVLHLLAVGRSTQQIAEQLTISRLTARNHILRIEQKLAAHSRVAVVFHARHHGLI